MPFVNRFDLKQHHIDLLAKANICQSGLEWGSPCIDPKRPFGNSDLVGDMAPILDIETFDTDDGRVFAKGSTEQCRKVLEELVTALSIVLHTKSFVPGTYTTDDYGSTWIKV